MTGLFSPDTSSSTGVVTAEPVSSGEKLATSTLETEEYVDSKEHKEMKARVHVALTVGSQCTQFLKKFNLATGGI